MPNRRLSKGSTPKSPKAQKMSPNMLKDIEQGTVLLPGRRSCTCEATKHELISNCISCGRIVCKQEGSGPCFTCGNLVCTREEKEILRKKSKSSTRLYELLMGGGEEPLSLKNMSSHLFKNVVSPELDKAIEHKDRLLNFDKNMERCTRVIDDERDFHSYSSSKWLSDKQRETVQKKEQEAYDARHGSRLKRDVKFDLFGREVVEEPPNIDTILCDIDDLLKDDISIFDHSNAVNVLDYKPEYSDLGFEKNYIAASRADKRQKLRIQDLDLQCMSDEGMCLNVHQPEASLLITGIMKHCGITKYQSLRGRLWIRAESGIPRNEQIDCYAQKYKSAENFPKNFPTGCLLGCVELVDCLGQEEYRNEFPNGECASVYVLICENPKDMKVKIPLTDRKRIFKMDPRFHDAAKKTLQKLN